MSKLKNLKRIVFEASKIYASALPGEEFHPDYSDDKDIFRKVVQTDSALEKALYRYLTELSERAPQYVKWENFKLKSHVKAQDEYEETDLYQVNVEDERNLLADILITHLIFALIAGGHKTELDTRIDIGWNENDEVAQKFIRKYSMKLAKDLTKTTVSRLQQSLLTSIDKGEDIDQATKRLTKVLKDPKRAATIAHTESVKVFSVGRLEVAHKIGADRKQWDATTKPCPICSSLNGKIVKLDQLFPGGYDAPPAHPNCRCIIQILMPDE